MINWNKVNEKTPEFKKIVLGVKLPNEIELVRLDRIDENGPIFYKANSGFELADIFTLRKTIDIDKGNIYTRNVWEADPETPIFSKDKEYLKELMPNTEK